MKKQYVAKCVQSALEYRDPNKYTNFLAKRIFTYKCFDATGGGEGVESL